MKSSRNLVIALLAATTIGGAVVVWRQYGELVAWRVADLKRKESAGPNKRVAELERRNRELEGRLASQRETAVAPDRSGKAERKGTPGEPSGGDRAESREAGNSIAQQSNAIRELMSKPEVQALLNVRQQAAIEQRYAPLFKNLNLPAESIERLKLLLAERAATLQDVFAAAREQGLNPREKPEAFQKLIADTQAQLNANIKSVIGENGFAQLTNFEKTGPQRNFVNELQQRVSYTSTPLTPAQAEKMVQILVANPPQRMVAAVPAPNGAGVDARAVVNNAMKSVPGVGMLLGVSDDSGSVAPSYPVTPAVLSHAQTVLTPSQLKALQQIQQQQQAQGQLKQLVIDTLVAGQPAGAKSGTPATTSSGPPPPPPPPPPPRKGGGGD